MKTLQQYKNVLLLFSIAMLFDNAFSMQKDIRCKNPAYDSSTYKRLQKKLLQKKFENTVHRSLQIVTSPQEIPIINKETTSVLINYLNQGANPNIKINFHKKKLILSLLQLACLNGNITLTKSLLNHHAKLKNIYGKENHPLVCVCISNTQDTNNLFYKKDTNNRKLIIKELIKRDTTINVSQKFNSRINKHLKAFLIKHTNHCFTDDAALTFTSLLNNIQKPLSLTMFYGNTQLSNMLKSTFPNDIITIIFNLYIALHHNERQQDWYTACYIVYTKQAAIAMQLLPFMTETEQRKLCKAYYLDERMQLPLSAKKN